jgi:hypothetical protein
MKQNETAKNPIYPCEKCKFITHNKKDFERHLLTRKHTFETNETNMKQNNPKKTQNNIFNCDLCSVAFTSRTTLWRHKKCCIINENKPNNTDDTSVIVQLIKQNDEFKTLLLEQNKTIVETHSQLFEMCKNGIIQNNTINQVNSHNKTFNLQVFLNEDCKDAMNISDFMSSIQLQLEELVSVGKLGFVEGISNIIIKNLKALDIHKRPLHCTDLKRETVYIKDNGVWVKDDEANTKLRKVIKNVAFRNSKNTRLFKDKYPDCVRSESRLSDTYSIIIIEAMGGGSKTDPKESEDKILRRILKELTIDKSKYLS